MDDDASVVVFMRVSSASVGGVGTSITLYSNKSKFIQ